MWIERKEEREMKIRRGEEEEEDYYYSQVVCLHQVENHDRED